MGKLGVIADDFTGATDIAGFLVAGGIPTIQTNGIPTKPIKHKAEALVVSLKTRSCSKEIAVEKSLHALEWLKKQGCTQFYFKYCSTFDSTSQGNIGPVTDALMKSLKCSITVVCPSLPVNGRTVYKGYLFVKDDLLSDSGMRHHPITPMLDSKLSRVMDSQSIGSSTELFVDIVEKGPDAITAALHTAEQKGFQYVVIDSINQKHLDTIALAVKNMKLLTGGSGLAIGLTKLITKSEEDKKNAYADANPPTSKSVILSGSCSLATNRQVDIYKEIAPSLSFDIDSYLGDSSQYIQEVVEWVISHNEGTYSPIIYATKPPQIVEALKKEYPNIDIGIEVENFFGILANRLSDVNVKNFIIAGGETSGVVAQTLGIEAFHIGPQIDPGVPWVKATDKEMFLALKSGNFGSDDFFRKAQEVMV